jgi:hypothetical protein
MTACVEQQIDSRAHGYIAKRRGRAGSHPAASPAMLHRHRAKRETKTNQIRATLWQLRPGPETV